jgi:hypothetical protein
VVKVDTTENLASGAKTGCEKTPDFGEIGRKCSSVAKASVDSIGFMRGLKPPPPSGMSFSAACKAQLILLGLRTG